MPAVKALVVLVVARVAPDTPYSQQGRLEPGAAGLLLVERDSALMYLAFRVER